MDNNRIENYKRLPGKGRSFAGYSQLWLASDHLLFIQTTFGMEKYNRFYFNDIQSILYSKTITGKIWNVVICLFSILFLVFALNTIGAWSGFHTIVSIAFLIWLITNVLRGPTCDTYLQTAIHIKKLSSLNRVKHADKSMDTIKTLVEKTQGNLTQDMFRENMLKQSVGSDSRGISNQYQPEIPSLKSERGKVHTLLFMLLILDSFFVIPTFFYTHITFGVISTITILAAMVAGIIALVRQAGSTLTASIRKMTWCALFFICASFIFGYTLNLMMTFQNIDAVFNQWEMWKRISEISPYENKFVMFLNIYSICGAAFLGIPGLIMMKKNRNQT